MITVLESHIDDEKVLQQRIDEMEAMSFQELLRKARANGTIGDGVIDSLFRDAPMTIEYVLPDVPDKKRKLDTFIADQAPEENSVMEL